MSLAELEDALARPKLADRPKPQPSSDHRERARVARRSRKRRRGRTNPAGAAAVLSSAPAACGYCGSAKAPGRHVCAACAERIEARAAELRKQHKRSRARTR